MPNHSPQQNASCCARLHTWYVNHYTQLDRLFMCILIVVLLAASFLVDRDWSHDSSIPLPGSSAATSHNATLSGISMWTASRQIELGGTCSHVLWMALASIALFYVAWILGIGVVLLAECRSFRTAQQRMSFAWKWVGLAANALMIVALCTWASGCHANWHPVKGPATLTGTWYLMLFLSLVQFLLSVCKFAYEFVLHYCKCCLGDVRHGHVSNQNQYEQQQQQQHRKFASRQEMYDHHAQNVRMYWN